MNAYAKYFDKNSKYMNLSVNDKEILEKYSETWNKIRSLKKNLIVNQYIIINTKIKIDNDRVYTNTQINVNTFNKDLKLSESDSKTVFKLYLLLQ